MNQDLFVSHLNVLNDFMDLVKAFESYCIIVNDRCLADSSFDDSQILDVFAQDICDLSYNIHYYSKKILDNGN